MKKISDLKTEGSFGVFKLKNENLFLVVTAFKEDKVVYCVANCKEKVLYIPSEYTDSSMKSFVVEIYDTISVLYKLTRIKIQESRVIEFTDDYEVISIYKAPSGVVPATLETLKKFFDDHKVDATKFVSVLKDTYITRDYSKLISESAKARAVIANNKSSLGKAVLDDEYLTIAEGIKKGKFTLIYLVGPAGTGKSTLAYLFGQYCGAPVINCQGSEGVSKDELIGCSDVKTDFVGDETIMEAKTVDAPRYGSFTVIVGDLLRAYREGYQIIIDEANYMVPGVMSVINSMTDSTSTYSFKGEIIKRNPNFVLYLTSNPGYEGTYLYNPATKSRGLTILIRKLTEKTFVKRMRIYNDILSLEFYKKLFPFQDLIQDYAKKWNETSAVCIRHAQNFVSLITSKPQTFEDFKNSFMISYLYNALCMDGDNTAKLDTLMKDESFTEKINDLYASYDYRMLEDVSPSSTFDEIFEAFDTDWAEDSKETTIEDDESDFNSTFNEEDFK